MWARWEARWSRPARAWPSWVDRKKLFSTPTTTVTSLARTRIGCPESSGGGKVKSSKSWGGKKTLERRNVTLFTPTFDCQMRERIASFDSSSSRESRSPRLSVGSETRQARMLKQISVKTDRQQRGTPSFIVFDRKTKQEQERVLVDATVVGSQESSDGSSSGKAEKTGKANC